MCCIFFTLHASRHTLILASNRDEYLSRPTTHSAWHCFPDTSCFEAQGTRDSADPVSLYRPSGSNHEQKAALLSTVPSASHPVLSGIDVHPSGGGTWLGITRSGRWAALTNFTETKPLPPLSKDGPSEYQSRGKLVRDWLQTKAGEGDEDLQTYATKLGKRRSYYAGLNLFLGQLPTRDGGNDVGLAYITNRNRTVHGDWNEDEVRSGEGKEDGLPGEVRFYPSSSATSSDTAVGSETSLHNSQAESSSSSMGLSNSVLSEPWSKVTSGRAAFDEVVSRYEATSEDVNAQHSLEEGLFDVLSACSLDGGVKQRQDLRRTVCVPPCRPQATSNKIDDGESKAGGWYATRTATVILVSKPMVDQETGRSRRRVTFLERDVHVLTQAGTVRRRDPQRKDEERRWEFELEA